jgi:hypothetical protein
MITSSAISVISPAREPSSGQDGAHEECVSARGRKRRGPFSPLLVGQGEDRILGVAGRLQEAVFG